VTQKGSRLEMAELLLEILSEEIPARMQARAAEDLKRPRRRRAKGGRHRVTATAGARFATPRRLTLVVDGLPTAARRCERGATRPPASVAPEQAGARLSEGRRACFARPGGRKRDTGKGEFWFARAEEEGRADGRGIARHPSTKAMKALPWPKSMKMGQRHP